MKGLAVLVLRYRQPGQREFRVPLNLKIGNLEIPVGLGLITITLFAICAINLFTKQVATVSGIGFTIIFFAVFTTAEKITHKRGTAHAELDQFNLQYGEDVTPRSLDCRPGNILVPVSNYHALYHLDEVLERVNRDRRDVVVLHIRLLQRAGSGEHGLEPDQLFSSNEQFLFTRVLALSEKRGESVHLTVVSANDVWDGILRAAQSLESSRIVLGRSSKFSGTEEARDIGLAWERLPEPRPQFDLEIFTPAGGRDYYILGPHAPHLTPREVNLIHEMWLQFSERLAPQEVHHHDIVHFALSEVMKELAEGRESEVLARLRQHIEEKNEGTGQPSIPS